MYVVGKAVKVFGVCFSVSCTRLHLVNALPTPRGSVDSRVDRMWVWKLGWCVLKRGNTDLTEAKRAAAAMSTALCMPDPPIATGRALRACIVGTLGSLGFIPIIWSQAVSVASSKSLRYRSRRSGWVTAGRKEERGRAMYRKSMYAARLLRCGRCWCRSVAWSLRAARYEEIWDGECPVGAPR